MGPGSHTDNHIISVGAESHEAGDSDREASEDRKPLSKRIVPELLIFFTYLCVTLFLTWPVIIKLNSATYGIPSDNVGSLWLGWWIRTAGSLGFKVSFSPLVGFPFGTRIPTFPLEFMGRLTDRFLLLFANEVVVLNINILLSFFLSGVTMYFLVRHLVRDRRVAFFAGFAYLICVYHAVTAMVWPSLAVTQWMPLFILVLILFMEKPTWKTGVGLALVEVLVAGTSIHYGFFMLPFTVVFVSVYYLHGLWKRRHGAAGALDQEAARPLGAKPVLIILLMIAIVAIVLTPVLISGLGADQATKWPTTPSGAYVHDTWFAQQAAARPIYYISPRVPNSYLERAIAPILGKSSLKYNLFVGPEMTHSIYIGWTIIVLAALAMFLKRGRKGALDPERAENASSDSTPGQGEKKKGASGRLRTRSLIWGFFGAAVACFILSLPPHIRIGALDIPLPSILMRVFAPWFRFYIRIGIVVVLCSIVLASYGLSWVLERVHKWALVVLAVSVVLLSVEMVVVPPFRYFETGSEPPLYSMLESLPAKSALALYPISGRPGGDLEYLFAQRWFKKPMINGFTEGGDSEAVRRTVYNPFVRETPSILRRFGIEYFVYYPKLFDEWFTLMGAAKMTDSGVSDLPSGLEPIGRARSSSKFQDAIIYRISAPMADVVPLYLKDFTVPELNKERKTWRLSSGNGLIKLLNYGGRDIRATLRIPIANLMNPQQIKIVAKNRTLWEGGLSPTQSTVIELRDVVVPERGLDLRVLATGQEMELVEEERAAWGISQASFMMSDVEILTNEQSR